MIILCHWIEHFLVSFHYSKSIRLSNIFQIVIRLFFDCCRNLLQPFIVLWWDELTIDLFVQIFVSDVLPVGHIIIQFVHLFSCGIQFFHQNFFYFFGRPTHRYQSVYLVVCSGRYLTLFFDSSYDILYNATFGSSPSCFHSQRYLFCVWSLHTLTPLPCFGLEDSSWLLLRPRRTTSCGTQRATSHRLPHLPYPVFVQLLRWLRLNH